MSQPNPFGPRAPFGVDLAGILQLAAALKGNGAIPAAAPAEPQGDPARLVREVIRASFADDPRGARLRAAWKQIGAGAVELLQAFAEEEQAPSAS